MFVMRFLSRKFLSFSLSLSLSLCLLGRHFNFRFSNSCGLFLLPPLLAYLSCESGEMIVKVNFTSSFRGVAYANYDRTTHCKFAGDGHRYYEMRIPLRGCGTKQVCMNLLTAEAVKGLTRLSPFSAGSPASVCEQHRLAFSSHFGAGRGRNQNHHLSIPATTGPSASA